MPGDTIVVELKYTELLVPTDGVYEFVYPTVVGPRYSETRESQAAPATSSSRLRTRTRAKHRAASSTWPACVSTGVPIQELVSPSHQVDVRAAGLRAEITLADSERLSGNRDVILRYRLAGEEIASGLLLYQGPRRELLPPDGGTAAGGCNRTMVPPREYIFVVDVSGSMHGFPLDTAKKLMSDLAGVLRPSDTFNVVVFADGSDTFASKSVTATRRQSRRVPCSSSVRRLAAAGRGSSTRSGRRSAFERQPASRAASC